MYLIVIIIAIWLIALGCYRLMKKIQPESAKLYLVYVLFVCVAFTLTVIMHAI